MASTSSSEHVEPQAKPKIPAPQGCRKQRRKAKKIPFGLEPPSVWRPECMLASTCIAWTSPALPCLACMAQNLLLSVRSLAVPPLPGIPPVSLPLMHYMADPTCPKDLGPSSARPTDDEVKEFEHIFVEPAPEVIFESKGVIRDPGV